MLDRDSRNADPMIARMLENGANGYDRLVRGGAWLSVHPLQSNRWWVELRNGLAPEQVPPAILSEAQYMYRHKYIQSDGPLSIIHTRVLSYIQGFGLQALEQGDLGTGLRAMSAVSGAPITEDGVLGIQFTQFLTAVKSALAGK